MSVGSLACLAGTASAVGAEKAPVKMLARPKKATMEVFMMKTGD